MTLSVANIEPPVVLQAASVGSVAAAAPVQAPVSSPTASAPALPQDGVDRVPHADVVLKDVLVHANPRAAAGTLGPMGPLQTPQAQLLAQNRLLGTPFAGVIPGLGSPGAAGLAKPAADAPLAAGPAKAADVPVPGAPLGQPVAAPAAGQPAAQPAAAQPHAGPQAQAAAAHAPASPAAVNPNPPPPPNAPIARQKELKTRWRPRDPRDKQDGEGRDGNQGNRSS